MKKPSTAAAIKPKKVMNYATPALEKGLDVLELLAHEPEGLTKSQVARKLNRTVSEIFRMLLCLERRGYIAQVDQERYSLTLKLFKLVQEHPPTERLILDAFPVMNRFAHETMQSCHIGVLEGDRVVILAHQDDEQRERMLEAWSRETGKKPPRDLDMHLERIRKTGYEKRASYLVKGVVNISFPIFGDRGIALAAITVPFIQHSGSSMQSGHVIEALKKASMEITHALGGTSTKK